MQIQIRDLGIITNDLNGSRDFYTKHLGFEPVFVGEGYVHLKNGSVELGLMAGKPDMPATPANGVWLSLGVANVDAEYARLKAAGATIDSEPKDQPWGERCFIVRDPNGFGVNLCTPIPVNEEFMRAHNQLVDATR